MRITSATTVRSTRTASSRRSNFLAATAALVTLGLAITDVGAANANNIVDCGSGNVDADPTAPDAYFQIQLPEGLRDEFHETLDRLRTAIERAPLLNTNDF